MRKTTIAVLLSIVAVLGGLILNFRAFMMTAANELTLLVTVFCMILWVFVLFLAAKSKGRKVLLYCSVFWIITALLSAMGLYVVTTGFPHNWAISLVVPLQILTLGQLAGVVYFTNHIQSLYIALIVISLGMSVVSLILYRRSRRG
ncbi:MAG: hypothetical protein FWC72_05575 [Oscillospiraceae bacterium]|nr:hypothetical protein [Oscillospiraceae bacterium]